MPQQRNYYVLCDDNCRFPSMTYEQILEAIAEATGTTPVHIEDAFITKIVNQNNNTTLKLWKGTEAQYNALETHDSNTIYLIDTNTVRNTSIYATKTELNDAVSELSELITDLTTEVAKTVKKTAQTFTAAEQQQIKDNIGVVDDLAYKNITVPAANFEESTDSEMYPYRAAVSLANVTENNSGTINFAFATSELGIYSGSGKTYNGGVYVYASEMPTEACVIDNIIITNPKVVE